MSYQGNENSLIIPIMIVAASVLFMAWWYWRKHYRRGQFKLLASDLGFTYVDQAKEETPAELRAIPMPEDFYEICSYKIVGERDNIRIAVFDLTCFEFKLSKNFSYTGIAFLSPKLDLPLFTLKPRNRMEEQIAKDRGVQFPGDFSFTSSNRINAIDWAPVREVMNAEFREQLRDNEEISLIGNEGTLFLNRYPMHMSIREVKRRINQGLELIKALEATTRKDVATEPDEAEETADPKTDE